MCKTLALLAPAALVAGTTGAAPGTAVARPGPSR